jgi:hypothetical protein
MIALGGAERSAELRPAHVEAGWSRSLRFMVPVGRLGRSLGLAQLLAEEIDSEQRGYHNCNDGCPIPYLCAVKIRHPTALFLSAHF